MIFDVSRDSFSNLPALVVTAMVVGFVVPVIVIALFGRRIR